MEPGIYGTDGTDPEEASGVLEPEDSLDGTAGVRDVLDTGWSPAERPWAVDDWGTTEAEEAAGESLDGRLARELPDRADDEGDGPGDSPDTHGGPPGGGGSTARWAASGAAGSSTPATAAPPMTTTSSGPRTRGSTARPPRR